LEVQPRAVLDMDDIAQLLILSRFQRAIGTFRTFGEMHLLVVEHRVAERRVAAAAVRRAGDHRKRGGIAMMGVIGFSGAVKADRFGESEVLQNEAAVGQGCVGRVVRTVTLVLNLRQRHDVERQRHRRAVRALVRKLCQLRAAELVEVVAPTADQQALKLGKLAWLVRMWHGCCPPVTGSINRSGCHSLLL
jgi:hypothetical protein